MDRYEGDDKSAIIWALRRAVDWLKGTQGETEVIKILSDNGFEYDGEGHLQRPGSPASHSKSEVCRLEALKQDPLDAAAEERENEFRNATISGALAACEKYGYPSSDEPLCILVDDIVTASLKFVYANSKVSENVKALKDEMHDIELAAEQFLAAYLSDNPKVGFLAFQFQSVLSFFRKRRPQEVQSE